MHFIQHITKTETTSTTLFGLIQIKTKDLKSEIYTRIVSVKKKYFNISEIVKKISTRTASVIMN